MRGRKPFAASVGVTSPVAAIVIVIIVCGSAFGIVELQLSSTDSGRSTITATVTTTLISISTTTIVSSTHLSQGGIAQVTVTAASLRSSDFLYANAAMTFTCGAAGGSFLTLSNTGTAGTEADSVTINWAGQTNGYSLAAGSMCLVGASGSASATQNLLFATTTKLLRDATAGGTFSGSVSLGSGAVLIFTGTFQ